MDRQKLQHLIAKIDAVSTSQDKETVLTLDEYFDGNTEEYSILCANTEKNHRRLKSFAGFCARLKIRQTYHNCWCVSTTMTMHLNIAIAGSIRTRFSLSRRRRIDAVRDWFAPLAYSDIYEETDFRTFNNFPPVSHGFRVFGVWWD